MTQVLIVEMIKANLFSGKDFMPQKVRFKETWYLQQTKFNFPLSLKRENPSSGLSRSQTRFLKGKSKFKNQFRWVRVFTNVIDK